ncbi:RNA-directed DNA polymerase from mobile element jockey-like protein [Aphelenchoides avenae]|nr:RNA-directed DNA polymerase from mobile element jockey-like protein [Aphelenchus avenae]
MERCVRQRLMQWLDDNELLPQEQFGFRPGRSVQDCLTVCLEDWSTAVDQGKCVDIITFDFSSAFDRVPHARLLAKLAHLGFEGYILQWIATFLGDRTSAVTVGDECGYSFSPPSGTPQGSCLGPVLFIIYVHDISSVVEAPCKFAQYADDVQFWQVHDGSENGFTLRNDLSPKDRVRALARSASARLYMAARTIRSGNVQLWKRIYANYVRPVLESSSPLFSPSTIGLQKDLETVQRRFTLMLELRSKRCHRDDRDSYEKRCATYDIPPLFHRRAIADILYAYKIFKSLCGVPSSFFKPLRINSFHYRVLSLISRLPFDPFDCTSLGSLRAKLSNLPVSTFAS